MYCTYIPWCVIALRALSTKVSTSNHFFGCALTTKSSWDENLFRCRLSPYSRTWLGEWWRSCWRTLVSKWFKNLLKQLDIICLQSTNLDEQQLLESGERGVPVINSPFLVTEMGLTFLNKLTSGWWRLSSQTCSSTWASFTFATSVWR